MNERIDLHKMEPLIEEMLEENGNVTLTVAGISMQPMIYHRRDTFTLKKPEFPLKKYDLPLYKREDGSFILHRIIKTHGNGSYTCRGDNQKQKEYPVLESVGKAFDIAEVFQLATIVTVPVSTKFLKYVFLVFVVPFQAAKLLADNPV